MLVKKILSYLVTYGWKGQSFKLILQLKELAR